MNVASKIKGYIFSLLATLALSNVYIFSKAAMQEVSMAAFGILWFSLSLVWNFIYALVSGSLTHKNLNRSAWFSLLAIGFSELISTSAFFTAINLMENPTMVSFLANTSSVFAAFLGFTLLKERFNIWESAGILLTLLGVVILSSPESDGHFQFLFKGGTIATLVFALFYAISTIIAKKNIGVIHASHISLTRTLFLLAGSLVFTLWQDQKLTYTFNAILNIGIGSILGPFLGSVLTYAALKYIEATKTVIIISTRSFFILLGSFLYFGLLPQKEQIIGGTITVLGIVVIALGEKRKADKRKRASGKDAL